MEVCLSCKKSFKPQLTDEDILSLFYEPEELERIEFFRKEYPHANIPEPYAPYQILCDRCSNDPDVEVRRGMSGDLWVTKKEKKDSKIVKEVMAKIAKDSTPKPSLKERVLRVLRKLLK